MQPGPILSLAGEQVLCDVNNKSDVRSRDSEYTHTVAHPRYVPMNKLFISATRFFISQIDKINLGAFIFGHELGHLYFPFLRRQRVFFANLRKVTGALKVSSLSTN